MFLSSKIVITIGMPTHTALRICIGSEKPTDKHKCIYTHLKEVLCGFQHFSAVGGGVGPVEHRE